MNNVFWSYGEQGAWLAAFAAAFGTCLNLLLGGWDQALQALVFFMVLDFVLGFLAAKKSGSVNSKVMLWGGVNKILVLCLVAVGVILDGIIATGAPYIRNAVVWFYIARELLSMVENYGKMGNRLPPVIMEALEQIKGHSQQK